MAFWRRRFLLRPKGSLLELEECRRRFAAKRSAYGAWLGVEALSVELKRERALAKDREDAAEACAAAERAAAEREEAARKAEVRRRHIERDAENAARAANDARRMLDLKDACDAEEAAENCRRYLRKVKRAKAASAYTTIAAFVSFRAWRRKRAARKARREAESIEEACARKTMHLADVESRKLVEFWRVEGMRELRERMHMRDAELYMINIIQTRARAKQAEERRRAALRADAELAKRVARAAAVRLDMLARRRERLNAGDAAVACARAAFSAASEAVARVADVGAVRRSAEASERAEAEARAAKAAAEADAREAARAAAAAREATDAALLVANDRRAAAEAAAEAMVRAFHKQDERDDAARRRARAVLDQLDPVARRLAVVDPACLQRAARLFSGKVPLRADAPPPPPPSVEDDWARRAAAVVPPPPPRVDAPQAVYDDTPAERSAPGRALGEDQLHAACGGDCTRVPTLDLSVEKLGGDLSSLRKCAKLEKLNLSVNELEAFDLVALGRALAATRVRTLALRDNRLAGGLANLNRLKLTALHLDVNRLTSIKALGLRQLRELSVCDNKLGSSGDGGLSLVLRCAPCLEVLRAAGNALSTFDCLARAPKLRELELSRNTLVEFDGHGASSSFPALVDLALAHNALRRAPRGLRLAGLERLRIGGNRFEKLDDLAAQEAWLPRLQRLDAADGAITNLGEALRCCPAVEVLNLAHNAFADFDNWPPRCAAARC